MIEISNMRTVLMVNADGAATNADTTANVDTRGYDSCRIAVFQSTTTAPTTLKVEHGDTTDATSFATINATGGTDFTIPAAPASTNNPLAVFDVVTAGLRRYLRLTVRPATATANLVAVAELGRPLTGVDSATDIGAGAFVVIPPR